MNLTDVVGTVVDGKYQVERMLGRGGMGAVFFATHLGTERPVALKIIVPQYAADASFLERFRREARAAGRFRHPNIVDVTDFGQADICGHRVAYLVMEYLDGCSLEDVLMEQPVVPVDWTVEVFDQLALGIGELHRKGIIHRDLKPGNIWLEPNLRGSFTVKLLDFGLAKLHDQEPIAEATSTEPAAPVVSRIQATIISGSGAFEPSIEPTITDPPASEAPTVVGKRPAGASNDGLPASEAPTILGAQSLKSAMADDPPTEAPVTLEGAVNETLLHGSARPTVEPPSSPVTEPVGDLTVAGSVLGTPAYMSPEQCRGEVVTTASDVYSLGVIAYQMLGGALPFEGGMAKLMAQHMHVEPQPLTERNPDVPRAVAEVVMSALAKDVSRRPATAELFAAALKSKAESPLDLISRALVMLIEHAPVFFRTTAILLTPFIVLVAAEALIYFTLVESDEYGSTARLAMSALGPLNWIVILLGTIFARGVITLLIGQILLAPLKKLRVELVFSLLKRMLVPALQAAVIIGLAALLPATIGFGLFKVLVFPSLVPAHSTMESIVVAMGTAGAVALGVSLLGIAYLVACETTQLANVILVEGLPIRQALRRSRELRRRTTPDTLVVGLFVLLPLLTPTVIELVQWKIVSGPTTGGIAAATVCALRLVVITFNAVLIATLYFKQRLTAGESIEAVLACQFVSEPPPKTAWQQRLNVSLESLRSGDRSTYTSGVRSGARSGARSGSEPPKANG